MNNIELLDSLIDSVQKLIDALKEQDQIDRNKSMFLEMEHMIID